MNNIIIASNKNIEIKDLKNNYIKVYYKEGILEVLDIKKDIDRIYIFEKVEGIINNKTLISKIKSTNKNIKIIYILEKNNSEEEKELYKIGINKIYVKGKNKKIKQKNNVYLITGKINETNLNSFIENILNKFENKKILIINMNKIKHYKIKNKNIKIIEKNINYNKCKKIYNYIFVLNNKIRSEKELEEVDKIILKLNEKNLIDIIEKIKKYNKKEKIIILKKRGLIDNELLRKIIGKNIKIINIKNLN